MINYNLKQAFDTIRSKELPYTLKYAYFDGNAPLKYSTDRIRRAFDNLSTYFSENWCGVIINAVLDRLILKGFYVQDENVDKTLDELFHSNNLQLDAYDVHESALVTGESFIIVDIMDGKPQIYYNDPRYVTMVYDPSNPKLKLYAAKLWKESENMTRMDLYYPDKTEHYTSEKGRTSGSFTLESETPNPFGVIPVFHFRCFRRGYKSELDISTISLQDAINKLLSDMMVAAEFEAFKMRVFISQTDPGDLKIGPDKKLWLPANEGEGQNTQVIELGGSDLQNFLRPMNELSTAMAIITRTPRHYFVDAGAGLSGDALIAMESPLTKKVLQRQENFSVTWCELVSFLLQILGYGLYNPSEISTVWEPVASIQPVLAAQLTKTEVESGIPLKVSLKRQGWSAEEIAELDSSPADTIIK
jgi:hypothetical protein